MLPPVGSPMLLITVIQAKTKPIKRLPLSPMKIVAGLKLKNKNAANDVARTSETTNISGRTPANKKEKLKALQLTLDKIEKGYGKGTI